MQPLDITKLTVEQLKALAYDEVRKMNQAQQNLQLLEAEMAKRNAQVDSKDKIKSVEKDK